MGRCIATHFKTARSRTRRNHWHTPGACRDLPSGRANPLGDISQNGPPVRGSSAVVEADAAYDKFVEDNLRRNYIGHFMHGMLGMTGFRLVNTPTFVPAYLHSISGSDFWVGIGTSLQQLGMIVSPIVGASQIEHRK